MGRVLSTIIAVALLLGLGALAVLALPGAGAPMTASPVAAAPLAAEPDAPALTTATNNYNMIAMPLNALNQFTSAGFTFDADGLAKLIGSGVLQVAQWDAGGQQYQAWTIDPEFGGSGTNFPLTVAGAYWVLLDSTASNIISFVGEVPAQGSVYFTFVKADPCVYNQFSLPLDQALIANADDLAAALGATQVSQWNASAQLFESWTIDPEFGGSGTKFLTKIGYPYVACLPSSAPTTWPQ